jgi:GAF domain/ANTAR domain
MALSSDRDWQARQTLARSLISAESPRPGSDGLVSLLERLCLALTHHVSADGAAIHLMSSDGSDGVAAASSNRCKALVELEFTTGEGPSHDAFIRRKPVLIPDLRSTDGPRWPGYASAAVDAGARAVFAFPLHVGAAGLGVLDLYVDQPGSLPEDDLAMALMFAQIATEVLLDGRMTTPEGELNPELASALDYRAEIYQAQGMLMVSLGVGLAEALVRMRAHAFSEDRPLIEVAHEIIGGRTLTGDDQ